MKADQVLIDHHEVLRGLLKQLDATTDDQGPKRRKLLDSLVSELGFTSKLKTSCSTRPSGTSPRCSRSRRQSTVKSTINSPWSSAPTQGDRTS